MKILWTDSSLTNIMSMIFKFAVLASQVLVSSIHAYTNVSVTIDGSITDLKGTVSVSIDGDVRKICAGYRDWEIASVVCRDLGHGPPVMTSTVYDFTSNFYNGQNIFPCNGDETSLAQCYDSTYKYYSSCSFEALEVECLPDSIQNSAFDIRLVQSYAGGSSGVVLVFYAGRWGTVCSSDEYVKDIICQQLGYSENNGYSYTETGNVFEDPVLKIDYCNYWDTSIQSCEYSSWSIDRFCYTVAVDCVELDSYDTYDTYDSHDGAGTAAGFSVVLFFLIILCCTGVICCLLCRKKNRPPGQTVTMSNVTSGAAVPLQSQQPVVHPPPPPYKDVVGPTNDSQPPPVYNPNMAYPSAPGYPPVSSSGYPTQPGPGYPTQPGPGYPTQPGPGYPTQPGPGYPTQPGPGYPTQPGPGYPTQPSPGYPTQPGPGYPPAPGPGYPPAPGQGLSSAPGPSYPSASGGGYPPTSDAGELPPKNSGFIPGSGTDYQSSAPPSFAPVADDSSRIAQTDYGPPPPEGQDRPAPSAPPADVPSASE